MTEFTRRTLARAGGLGLIGTLAAPAVARAQTRRWRMVTSWPKRLPGPGMSAERVAERIAPLSGGRLQITVHAAGEVVPAFEVLDAVGGGVAEMGHTAAFFWQGKQPATNFFTTVPFGLTPAEHVAWVDAGGGQALWDELYAPFGVKPFMGGNTGVCMGGWFRRELNSADDVKGLKIRSLGLGGEVYRRLGATPQTTSPGEILTSLQSGLIDGAEFVGPGTDIALGLYRVANFYYAPGFNKPNGTGECIVSLKAWDGLDSGDEGDRPARLCQRGGLRALRDGAAQRRSARRADRPAQCEAAHVSAGAHRCGTAAGERRARRGRRQERRRAQGARFLSGVPRAHRGLVAHLDQGGAGRAGGVGRARRSIVIARESGRSSLPGSSWMPACAGMTKTVIGIPHRTPVIRSAPR